MLLHDTCWLRTGKLRRRHWLLPQRIDLHIEQEHTITLQQSPPPPGSSLPAGSPDAPLTYDDVRALRYGRAVFLEALRLYPSVPKVPLLISHLRSGCFLRYGCRIARIIYTFQLRINRSYHRLRTGVQSDQYATFLA